MNMDLRYFLVCILLEQKRQLFDCMTAPVLSLQRLTATSLNTGSSTIAEGKQRLTWPVPSWVTTWK